MIAPVLSTTTDFSIYNTGWNGTSDLAISTYRSGKLAPTLELQATGTSMNVVHLDLSELSLDASTDALVIIGPSLSFSQEDSAVVAGFVRDGGMLLLADDFGTGNELLAGMGATSRFSNKLLMDLSFDKRPEFSVCFTFEDDSLTTNVTTVLLNYPTSLTVDPSTTKTIATSSVASCLDMNDDREFGIGEPRGPFPLIARESYGNGTIILLADPSILINGMQDELDNGVLTSNILSEIGIFRAAVYFDEAHRDYFDPISITAKTVGEMSFDSKFMILLISFVLLVWISTDVVDRAVAASLARLRRWLSLISATLFGAQAKPAPKKATDEEALAEETIKRHPEWRARLVRYAIKEHQRHSSAATASTPEEQGGTE
jgi:hypothetical protein